MNTNYQIRGGRISYIDALRGFTICLVVFGHVNSSIGMPPYDSVLGYFFSTFRMPMFFFISGFVTYKTLSMWNTDFFLDIIAKKARVQLVPMFVFLIAYTFFTIGSFPKFWIGGFDKYWFTLVLFEMLIIYFVVSYLGCLLHKDLLWIMVGISLFGIFALSSLSREWTLYKVLCLENFFKYIQFFTLGLFCRKYQSRFLEIVQNNYFKGVMISLFIWCFFVIINRNLIQNAIAFHFLRDILVRYLGLMTVFSIFASFDQYFSSDSFVPRIMRNVGKRTLDVYLIHYFFVPDLSFAYSFFNLNNQLLLQFLLIFSISVIIVCICMVISRCIRTSDILAYWLLGKS